MSEKKTAPIDIFDAALATKVGEPVEAELFGVAFKVMRDYTGDQVHEYISMFTDEKRSQKAEDQLNDQLKHLTDLTGDDLKKIIQTLLKRPIVETNAIMIKIGQIAGLRQADTSFTPGVLRY